MLTVYGTPKSRTSVVLWLLREIGMNFRHVDSPIFGDKNPEHLEANPEGTMPTIKDDDFVLTESMAITNYLAKKYGGDLGPKDLQEDAEILRWTMWAAIDADRRVVALVNNSGVDENHPFDAAKFEAAQADIAKVLTSFERKLGDNERDYLVGDRFTVADLNVAFVLSFLPLLNFDFSDFPKVEHFLMSAIGRASFRSILAPTEEHIADAIPERGKGRV